MRHTLIPARGYAHPRMRHTRRPHLAQPPLPPHGRFRPQAPPPCLDAAAPTAAEPLGVRRSRTHARTHARTRMKTCIHACAHACDAARYMGTHAWVHAKVRKHRRACKRAPMHARGPTCPPRPAFARARTHTRTRTHACTRARAHPLTHTHSLDRTRVHALTAQTPTQARVGDARGMAEGGVRGGADCSGS
jgi:hypothetical protein